MEVTQSIALRKEESSSTKVDRKGRSFEKNRKERPDGTKEGDLCRRMPLVLQSKGRKLWEVSIIQY